MKTLKWQPYLAAIAWKNLKTTLFIFPEKNWSFP